MLEVDGRAREPGQRDVAHDHELFRLGRHTGDAEPARPLPFVHVPTGRERLVLAVLRERHADPGCVLERSAHQPVVLHTTAVVGEQAHAQRGHLGHWRELLTLAADSDRTRNVDVAQCCLAQVEHLAHD
jgi:hypothetical protein